MAAEVHQSVGGIAEARCSMCHCRGERRLANVVLSRVHAAISTVELLGSWLELKVARGSLKERAAGNLSLFEPLRASARDWWRTFII